VEYGAVQRLPRLSLSVSRRHGDNVGCATGPERGAHLNLHQVRNQFVEK